MKIGMAIYVAGGREMEGAGCTHDSSRDSSHEAHWTGLEDGVRASHVRCTSSRQAREECES